MSHVKGIKERIGGKGTASVTTSSGAKSDTKCDFYKASTESDELEAPPRLCLSIVGEEEISKHETTGKRDIAFIFHYRFPYFLPVLLFYLYFSFTD